MMSKEAKKNYVEEMKKNFTDNESVMIAQYQGLNVNELDALRKELREKGILFKITKNTTNISTLVSFDIHKISGVEKKIEAVNKLSSFLTKDLKKK